MRGRPPSWVRVSAFAWWVHDAIRRWTDGHIKTNSLLRLVTAPTGLWAILEISRFACHSFTTKPNLHASPFFIIVEFFLACSAINSCLLCKYSTGLLFFKLLRIRASESWLLIVAIQIFPRVWTISRVELCLKPSHAPICPNRYRFAAAAANAFTVMSDK
jgi:Zn-dependent protease with chaperone function